MKKLPAPIVRMFRSAYTKWCSTVRIDPRLTRDLGEYFGVTYEQAVCLLKVGTRLNREVWKILSPKSNDEITQFYRINPFYIFSLAYWHMSRAQNQFRREIMRLSRSDVLDFGGGIGDLTLALAKAGQVVVYADIGGKTFDFARWLLARHGWPEIPMLDVIKDWESIWARKYSTIICIDVIEHIPTPKEVLERMAASLTENGRLIITGLQCSEPHEEHPMHLPITFDPDTLLKSLGFHQSEKRDWLWIKGSIRGKQEA